MRIRRMILNDGNVDQEWKESVASNQAHRSLSTCFDVEYMAEQLKSLWYWFKNGLTNWYKWGGVIWANREYDYSYLFAMLRHKLDLMKKHHEKHLSFEGVELEIEHLDTTIKALDRLLEDQYLERELESVNNKWGEPVMMYRSVDGDACQVDFICENVVTERDAQKYHNDYQQALAKADQRQRDDLTLVCIMLEKHSLKWWD